MSDKSNEPKVYKPVKFKKPPKAHGGEIIVREYCECASPEQRGYSQYYDAPEGCDVRTKVGVVGRYGAVCGMVMGTYDVLMYSHAMGIGNIMRRYAFHVLPLAAMGMTFATVANGLQIYRKVNDSLNYFTGGFACGPLVGYYLGSGHAILLGGLFLGAVGMVKKWGVDGDWVFFPNVEPHQGMIDAWRHDFTITEDPAPLEPLKEAKKRCEEDICGDGPKKMD